MRRALLAVLVLPLLGFAQAPGSGAIRGQVTDRSGAAVPGVEIAVTNTETGFARRAVAGDAGYYSVSELSLTGQYRIRFSKAGFAVQERGELRLRSGESAT